MAKASDNEFPSVLFDEQASDVSTPGTGLWRAYFKSDGLYVIDDVGTVVGPLVDSAGGGLAAESAKANRSSTAQSIPDATTTAVQFDTEVWDDNGLIDLATNATRITIQTAGKYVATATTKWAAAAGSRFTTIRLNGTTAVAAQFVPPPATTSASPAAASQILDLDAADYLELTVHQDSGAALDLDADVRNALAVARVA